MMDELEEKVPLILNCACELIKKLNCDQVKLVVTNLFTFLNRY